MYQEEVEITTFYPEESKEMNAIVFEGKIRKGFNTTLI